MNTPFPPIPALVLIVGSVFYAGYGHTQEQVRYAYATVLSSEPIVQLFRVSQPRQQCWNETVPVRRRARSSRTGTLLGGIIGAAIGNAVGHRSVNKRVGAVAGALLGASIGRDMTRRPGPVERRVVRRCETTERTRDEQRIVGYRVTYRFEGENYTARLTRDPGDSLKIRLSMTPIVDN